MVKRLAAGSRPVDIYALASRLVDVSAPSLLVFLFACVKILVSAHQVTTSLFKCSICKTEFYHPRYLKAKRNRDIETEEDLHFKCEVCANFSSSKQTLSRHKQLF